MPGCVFRTVSGREAAAEPPGMGSRRVLKTQPGTRSVLDKDRLYFYRPAAAERLQPKHTVNPRKRARLAMTNCKLIVQRFAQLCKTLLDKMVHQ